ncbi:lipid asymmetry maintenance protein MlaB [Candidatus Erwinia haradaeae]|uniref:Intermembrane phospholipid transport system binding protein MlaB n=1 Tax=Candidatus Erwinia haradaeae TaxID=1922217 RepID=A0A451D3S1_9GAMM|nr:lipid asymmetry maintenance protein MlaB [Candidatus Erwinia haradaeae]VFP80344.1 Intermembrane phospholipid transport system binding protein MlaB [Candidatus Erwinia haradaeae]
MNNQLKWKIEKKNLYLTGALVHKTLLPLWQQRHLIMKCVDNIDICKLTRVDTGGLALLIHLQRNNAHHQKEPCISISGITTQIHALITLYNLQTIINNKH